jgi:hypothetical protein
MTPKKILKDRKLTGTLESLNVLRASSQLSYCLDECDSRLLVSLERSEDCA